MQTRYDPRTAVTFLLAGVGLGAIVAMMFAPRERYISLAAERSNANARRGPSLSRAV